MRKILVNQENIIKAKSDEMDTITWEIDSDNDLEIKLNNNEIMIIPNKRALEKAFRRLKYTVEESNFSEIIEFEIVSAGETEKTEDKSEDKIIIKEIKKDKEGILINKPPVYVEFCEDESSDIVAKKPIISYSFSDEQYNSCLTLNQRIITIKNIPSGFYTLTYTSSNEKNTVYIHCTEKKKQSEQSLNQKPQKILQEVPENKQIEPNQDDRINWPVTKEKCSIDVYFKGQMKGNFSIIKHRPILIGKKSLSMKVVDIDLSIYSDHLDKVSRNHLKIWQNDEFLFMNNIGSHRCVYNNQEIFPEDMAVLKIGGKILLGEFTLIIIKD